MKIHLFTQKIIHILLLLTLLTSTIIGSAVPSRQAVAQTAETNTITAITLDGVREPEYVKVASDPAGDLGGPGGWTGTQWTDLTDLYVSADVSNLYVYADLASYTQSGSSGQIGLVLDTDGEYLSGGSLDPWGNAISFDYQDINGSTTADTMLPDYVIRGNIAGMEMGDNGWTELRSWNGSSWDGGGVNWGGISGGSQIGTNIAYSDTLGVEFLIPLADIGNPDPANVHLQLFATQSGGTKGAYDTVPSDNQSPGWDDPTTQTQLVSVPLAIDPPGDLASPGPGDWNGVWWTDMTRLNIWTDHENLNLFLPMEAYSTTLSDGQIGLVIDTQPGGGSGDAWANAITFAYTATHANLGQTPVVTTTTILPDYLIRGNIFGPSGNGWTELRTWNGANWDTGGGTDWGGIGNSGQGSLPGSKVAWTDGEGLRLRIPFTDIGADAGDMINLEFFGTQGSGIKGVYDTVPSDDQSTGWDDPTTQNFLASYQIPDIAEPPTPPKVGECTGGAAHDGNIWWLEMGHNSRDELYRNPGGAVISGTLVTLRLRAACGDLTNVQARIYNDRTNTQSLVNMELVLQQGQYEWWETSLPTGADPTVYWYRFIPMDGSSVAYYEDDNARTGGWGQTFSESQDNSWQLTVYDPAFETPDWVKNGIIYQIFPDRFRDGDLTNDTPAGSFFYDDPRGTIYRSNTTDWNQVICDPRDNSDPDCAATYSQNFYGGDLQGIVDQLDYLENLRITALYLNPIFESPSNHKYDTTDYSVIDDNFGDLATFQLLVTAAYSRGMSVILDGVFNHSSSDSIYFDRYGRYTSVGACESETSPYRDWYYFTDVTPGTGPCVGSDGTPNAADYESWWGYDSLPKLNANSQPVRDLIWDNGTSSIAPYWIDAGAAGWRLDVGGDVDPGVINDPTNDYWEGFRAAVRDVYTGTYIAGEEWGNASSWLLGNEWDAVMNYQYSTAMLGFWRDTEFVDNDHNPGSSAGPITPLDPSELDERLLNWLERYPPEALYAMMNLLGSHDTNRPLFMLDHNAANGSDDTLLDDPDYDWSDAIARLKGVAILQMTLPGAPTIYYGDEVGNVGPITNADGVWQDDPYNRTPYPWLDETGSPFYTFLQNPDNQNDLYDYYALLTSARQAHPALRTGSFDTLQTDDLNMVYAYGRKMADHSDAAVVILNRSGSTLTTTLDLDGYLPVGAQFINVLDALTYTVDTNGELAVSVPDELGAVLVLTGTMAVPPEAVADLVVTDERNAEIDLSWSAASGANNYDIYRSLLSGGGYEWITNTLNISYTDNGLQNAVDYYYVVVSRASASGLVSGYSNEAIGTPHHDLSTAWYNLQWPHEFTHTISAITTTENIYGQIWIDGATGSTNGPAEGILAQIGYGISGSITTTWTWVDMSYDQPDGSNDQYLGNLLPDMVGDYQYATHWSSDGGQTWYFSDIGGPGDHGNYGIMHVVPSSDTTAPAAPQNLEITGSTGGSISLGWDANSEPDMGGYDVYRQPVINLLAPTDFNRIARLDASQTSYIDTDVVTNESYEYYIQAFDTSFNFSPASDIVTGTAETLMVTVTFRVRVPDYSPGTIFVAGNLPGYPEWNPGVIPLNQVSADPNIWEVDLILPDGLSGGMYKYTRGSWDTVESWGSITGLNNRNLPVVDYGSSGTMLIEDTAIDWGVGSDDHKAVRFWRDPLVVNFAPEAGATNVDINTAISVTWSVTMPTDTSFDVTGPSGVVAGSFNYEPETFTVLFTPDAHLTYGSPYTVTVADQVGAEGGVQQVPEIWNFSTLALPTVQFSEAAYTVTESVTSAMITVTLNKPWTTTISVDAFAGGSVGITRTLSFTPGETSQVFEVPIPNDDLPEPDEFISLSLSNPISATLGSPYTATLTILDDDIIPEVQFSSETYTVTEGAGSAAITVTLSRAASFTITVDASAGGSINITETLTFTPGETSQVFEILVSDDNLDNPDVIVPLWLSNPMEATLGEPFMATLTILDDDPTIQITYLPVIFR